MKNTNYLIIFIQEVKETVLYNASQTRKGLCFQHMRSWPSPALQLKHPP